MARDLEKQSEWRRSSYVQIGVTLKKDGVIAEALMEAVSDSGVSKPQWAAEAIRQRLVKDGYILESDRD